jgi:hypothetical protein
MNLCTIISRIFLHLSCLLTMHYKLEILTVRNDNMIMNVIFEVLTVVFMNFYLLGYNTV